MKLPKNAPEQDATPLLQVVIDDRAGVFDGATTRGRSRWPLMDAARGETVTLTLNASPLLDRGLRRLIVTIVDADAPTGPTAAAVKGETDARQS